MTDTFVPSGLVDCMTDEFCAGVTDILLSIETDEFDTCVTDAISVCVTDRFEVADNVSLGVTNNPGVRLAAMEWFTKFSLTDADGLGTMRELPATVSLTEKQLKPKPLTHLNCHVLYLNLAKTKSSRVTHLVYFQRNLSTGRKTKRSKICISDLPLLYTRGRLFEAWLALTVG